MRRIALTAAFFTACAVLGVALAIAILETIDLDDGYE